MVANCQQRLCLCIATTLLIAIGALAAAIVLRCDGHFIYALDDPYISLSLSRNIAHGEYGINAGEVAAPSSSILYPFLLAGFAWASWQEWVPAIANALAAAAAGAFFGWGFCRYGIVTQPREVLRGAILAVALCLAVNMVGVVFTGLEHSLHMAVSVFVVLALARALEEDKVPAALVAAIVVLPLCRFEGLALAGLALLTLLLLGHRRAAIAAFIGIAVGVGGFMAALHAIGLPPLPGSVLVKSDLVSDAVDGSGGLARLVRAVIQNARGNINPEAVPACLLIVLVAIHPVLRWLRRDGADEPHAMSLRREFGFAAVVAGGVAAQLLFGLVGTFARYEVYAVAFGVAGAIVVWRREIAGVVAHDHAWPTAVAALGVLTIGSIYVGATLYTPLAARGIYEQQYQMHRFAVDFYRKPVGANDLGWVSYRNPHYVLDLAGIVSEATRRARLDALPGGNWLSRLAAERQIGLVMLYDQWFAGKIPPGWRRLAVLRAEHYLTATFDTVTFYATSSEAAGPALAALQAFSRDTPQGTEVTIFDTAADAALPRPLAARASGRPAR